MKTKKTPRRQLALAVKQLALKLSPAEADAVLACLNEADHVFDDELQLKLAERVERRLGKLVDPTFRWRERVIQKIYGQQHDYIVENFGRQPAAKANYGWGVDERPDGITVETKIYGHGVLVTEATYPSIRITHVFRERP